MLFDQFASLSQRVADLARILTAGLRHVGPSAAAAPHDWRDLLDEITRLNASFDDVVRDRGQQTDFALVVPANNDHRRTRFLLDAIDLRANRVIGTGWDFADDERDVAGF